MEMMTRQISSVRSCFLSKQNIGELPPRLRAGASATGCAALSEIRPGGSPCSLIDMGDCYAIWAHSVSVSSISSIRLCLGVSRKASFGGHESSDEAVDTVSASGGAA